jgi:lactobin A/cerein 7B family class IIb bacteriocin
MKELSESELKNIHGGIPQAIFAIYATSIGLYGLAIEALKAKGYSDGSRSAFCN